MATELCCESRIESVTVFARGAVVTRAVTLAGALPDEPCDVVIEGVTALADVGSLRASASGGREILGVHARRVVPEPPAVDTSLHGKLAELRRKRDDLNMERNHATWRRDVLASVQPDPELARRVLALDPAERIADALAVVELVTAEMAALDAKIADHTIALEKNEREAEALRVAAAQASEAEARATASALLSVLVQLGPRKASATLSDLKVEYAVNAARWWPVYRARFTEGATRAALALNAVVAQASGEDWPGVKLALSTGDLLRDARLPEMASLRLGRAQRPRARGYRPPPEGLDAMFEGYDRFVATVTVAMTATISASSGWDPSVTRSPSGYAAHLVDEDIDEPTAVAMLKDIPEAALAMKASKPRLQAPGPQQREKKPAPPPPGAYGPPPALGAIPQAIAGFGGAPPTTGYAAPPASLAAPAPQQAARQSASASMPKGAMEVTRTRAGRMELAAASIADDLLEETGALEEEQSYAIEPADAWLDFDMLRLDTDGRGAQRGRLMRERGPSILRLEAAAHLIERLEPPPGAIDPRASRGLFDAVYNAAGTADVPSSGRPHRVEVASAESAAAPRFVTVPREAAEVYRRADVPNPFGVPLLTGPVEIFIDGALVALTRLSYTDRGGTLSIGLGVEERLKVARNSRVEEGTAGLLGGSTLLDHTVTTDLSSSLGRAVKVEILDRLPVSDEKDVDIKLVSSQPQPSSYTQAELGQPLRKGLRWEVEVPAGGKAQATWRYRVTLPSKMEIAGGNRRE